MKGRNHVKLNTEQYEKLSTANNTSHNEKLVCPKIQRNEENERFITNTPISTSASS